MSEPRDPHVAVLANRVQAVEQQLLNVNSKLDSLLTDKARRDGAIAAGNWFTRAIWAVLGAFGMWFVEGQKP